MPNFCMGVPHSLGIWHGGAKFFFGGGGPNFLSAGHVMPNHVAKLSVANLSQLRKNAKKKGEGNGRWSRRGQTSGGRCATNTI